MGYGPRRLQEQYLVGLHDALPLAAGIADQEVRVPHRLDRRATRRRDQPGQWASRWAGRSW